MESLSLCIVAGVVLFYQTLFWTRFPDQSKYTEGVGGNKKIFLMMWLFQTVWTCAIPQFTVKHGLHSSQYSVLGLLLQWWRVREPCASQLWLVILAVAGEHYLPASVCRCTSFWVFAYKVKQLVTLQKIFFCISYIICCCFHCFFFFEIHYENVMSADSVARVMEARFAIAVIIVG